MISNSFSRNYSEIFGIRLSLTLIINCWVQKQIVFTAVFFFIFTALWIHLWLSKQIGFSSAKNCRVSFICLEKEFIFSVPKKKKKEICKRYTLNLCVYIVKLIMLMSSDVFLSLIKQIYAQQCKSFNIVLTDQNLNTRLYFVFGVFAVRTFWRRKPFYLKSVVLRLRWSSAQSLNNKVFKFFLQKYLSCFHMLCCVIDLKL